MNSSTKEAGEIIKRYKQIWMALENVTGVGTGKTKEGGVCIVISMAKEDPVTCDIFPAEIEDFPVEFRITGEMSSL